LMPTRIGQEVLMFLRMPALIGVPHYSTSRLLKSWLPIGYWTTQMSWHISKRGSCSATLWPLYTSALCWTTTNRSLRVNFSETMNASILAL
jgi:hypothetical protein